MSSFKKFGDSRNNLIFLHGWGGDWRSWQTIVERLKDRFTIYALDLPGFGENSLSKPYKLSDYVNFVINFLREEKIERPTLIGHSFGGRIAIKVAADTTSHLSKLVLVDCAGIRPKYGMGHYFWLGIAKMGKIFFPWGRNFFYKIRGLEKSDYFNLGKNEILKKTFINIIDEDLTSEIPKINIPTLIIWGGNDQETPLADGEKIHRAIEGSKLILFPNAGHFSYLDEQERFCKEIEKFAK